ncbi:MAG: hypothetical protein ACR2IZ_02235 [Candidatus Nanopelagicus sp.]
MQWAVSDKLRKFLFARAQGSAESFLTLIPQLFVFLVMFQLVFMQFSIMRESNFSQAELAKVAIKGGSLDYERYPLTGGGSVLLLDQRGVISKFIDFGFTSGKRVISIAVDENENN